MFYSWKLHELIYIFATFELKLRAVVVVVVVVVVSHKATPDSPPLRCPIIFHLGKSESGCRMMPPGTLKDSFAGFHWLLSSLSDFEGPDVCHGLHNKETSENATANVELGVSWVTSCLFLDFQDPACLSRFGMCCC